MYSKVRMKQHQICFGDACRAAEPDKPTARAHANATLIAQPVLTIRSYAHGQMSGTPPLKSRLAQTAARGCSQVAGACGGCTDTFQYTAGGFSGRSG